MTLFLFRSKAPDAGEHDLPFKIEAWDDSVQHVDELIALVGDFATAQATYYAYAAVKRRPGKLITLRQKARVIKKSR